MDDDSTTWLDNFKRLNGLNNTRGRFSNIQRPLPITSPKPRKHRLAGLFDLSHVELLKARRRKPPLAVSHNKNTTNRVNPCSRTAGVTHVPRKRPAPL
jgi:hypothetical protein